MHNSGFGGQFLRLLLRVGRGHFDNLPVIGIGFQSPKVFRAVELRTQPEALSVGPHVLAENYISRGLPASPAMQAQGASGIQLHREAERATVCADDQRFTDLGELGVGLQAGDADGNFDRDSRTAPYGVTVGSGHGDPLVDGEACTADSPSSLCITVP